MASPRAVEGEEVELEATMTEEVKSNGGQEEEAQAEEDRPEEYPTTPVLIGPSFAFDISPKQRITSSSPSLYANYCLLGLPYCQ